MDERPHKHGLGLYLLRHADAGDPDAWEGDDAERPLSKKGRRQAEALGSFLAARGVVFDSVVSSPKTRAMQTAELVAAAIGARVTADERLGDRLDLDALAGVIDDAGGSKLLLVGHDPDFSELCATLSGTAYLPLKKGALARLDVSLPVQPQGGILRWLLPPEVVGSSGS
jgi:phosphohistidine phosphatase SixA